MATEPPGDQSNEHRVAALEQEVSTLRAALEAARRSVLASPPNERLPAVIAHAPIVLFAFDADGTITLQEGQLLKTLGLVPGQRIGENVYETYRNLPASHPTIARSLEGHLCSWEGQVGPLDLQIRLVPELDASGRVAQVVGLAIDVSEQKRVERQLTSSEARFRTIMEQLPELVVVLVDKTGCVTWVTNSAERVIGLARERLIGTGALDFVPEERRGEVAAAFALLLSTPQSTFSLETEIVRPDGGRRWLEVSAMNGLQIPDFESVLVVYRDITERKKAQSELAATHEQLRQAQKLEAIGALAGGIAHDFNNLLTVILGCAGIALSELEPGVAVRADIEEIAGAAERASELTRQLLSFSRLRGLERMLARLLGEHIRLTLNLDPRPTRVFVDPTQLEQIIINLTVNSRDAMPEGGVLTIECAPAQLDEEYAAQHLEVRAGRYVMIAVSDTGVGMTPEVMARIFDPFFTTKEVGRGTGLGLSTVHAIV
ncbi:MAG TPA: PAS domain S-box protein, partial [Myxococcota bacterium]|nr:PAS domain S-box protein [Myxococcota bacterium]